MSYDSPGHSKDGRDRLCYVCKQPIGNEAMVDAREENVGHARCVLNEIISALEERREGLANMMLSECCSAPPWHELETGICGKCHMHAGFYSDNEEHNKDDVFSPKQQAIIDALMEEAPEE